MEHYQEYLATEVAIDHAEGLLSRREALRRLGMMGFSAVAATSLLAACGSSSDEDTSAPAAQPSTTAASGGGAATTVAGGAAAVATQDITYPGKNGDLVGALAKAASPKGAVLVIHENRGLTPHIKSVAGRLAGDGYTALAVDLLSEEGGSTKVGEANAGAALTNAGSARLVSDLHSSLDELAKRQPNVKYGVIGFCFGGNLTWMLLADGEPRLSAATPFYGSVQPDIDFSKSKAAVFAVYGELDNRVNGTREAALSALEKAGLTHDSKVYPGANHAFFNDTGANYNAAQATAAYKDVLDWYGRHLK
jgi:carboxymethylenebutenolidase